MGHDQLFKAVLERLLQGFLELFFPEVAARLDFETLRLHDKEVFANVPAGEVREADVVAQLRTRHGEPEIILIHVEVQARAETDFAQRMFEYYALLRLHHRLPVFPIVLYLRGGPESTGRGISRGALRKGAAPVSLPKRCAGAAIRGRVC